MNSVLDIDYRETGAKTPRMSLFQNFEGVNFPCSSGGDDTIVAIVRGDHAGEAS